MTNSLRIRLFALFRERLQTEFFEISVSGPITVAQLRQRLREELPDLEKLLSYSSFAVNHEFAPDDLLISPADDVAIIPPASGGESDKKTR
jgi:molybdopterin synthase catalytic subunit